MKKPRYRIEFDRSQCSNILAFFIPVVDGETSMHDWYYLLRNGRCEDEKGKAVHL